MAVTRACFGLTWFKIDASHKFWEPPENDLTPLEENLSLKLVKFSSLKRESIDLEIFFFQLFVVSYVMGVFAGDMACGASSLYCIYMKKKENIVILT